MCTVLSRKGSTLIILNIKVLILLLQGDTLVTTRVNIQRLLNDVKEAPPVFVGFGDLEERPIIVALAMEERDALPMPVPELYRSPTTADIMIIGYSLRTSVDVEISAEEDFVPV